MNYINNASLITLEYPKVINLLIGQATSEGGKNLCKELLPSKNIDEIKHNLNLTEDALSLLFKKGRLSLSGTKDVKRSLLLLEKEGSLSAAELLNISSLLLQIENTINYFKKDVIENDRNDESFNEENSLFEYIKCLYPLPDVRREIERCIISEDEIADDASAALKHIRRQIKLTSDKVHSSLTSIISAGTTKDYLQDNIITMRNGRYCIPVKAEAKNKIPGMIHDQSAKGSTIFIEPMETVRLNNEISDLHGKEKEEIARILKELSLRIAPFVRDISASYDALVLLDFIFAKASLAKNLKCSKPEFSDNRYINLKRARHPLLDPKKVVPIDVYIGDEFNLLIITGPNTGGKTVTLKTVGLLSLMGQAGLFIPCDEGSKLGLFKEFFADIGDEQSIEQNLSTFSAHMTNIVSIINQATSDSLILFDELCSGTDPVEGAALGISILTKLKDLDARVISTTHYSELKLFALQTPGVSNAGCEFDINTLSPTYRLLIGIPGKSNAFAISKKLGLSDEIIEDAKLKIDESNLSFEDILNNLENSRLEIDKAKEESNIARLESKKLKDEYENKLKRLEERKEKEIQKAKEEAEKLIEQAKEFADETIKELRKNADAGDVKALDRTRNKINDKKKKHKTGEVKKTVSGGHAPKDFHVGDKVKVLSMNTTGIVSSLPNAKGDMDVQIGIFKSKINYNDLIIVDEPDITGSGKGEKISFKTGSGKIKMNKALSVSSEIKLLGMTVDEALSVLDKYLDDAYLAHLGSVRIVHGKGTGALRSGIHSYLKKSSYIKEFHLGLPEEGGAGVTIATFK